MSILRSPAEGSFQNRTQKTPIQELLNMAMPIINETGDFSLRFAISNKIRCIYKFSKVPTMPIDLPIPDLDGEQFSMDGWDSLMVNHQFFTDKIIFTVSGKFGKERKESFFVNLTLTRLPDSNTVDDIITITDYQGNETRNSLFELMQIRNASGDPIFARFSDEYPSLDTEGILFMITRYVKSVKAQSEAPLPTV